MKKLLVVGIIVAVIVVIVVIYNKSNKPKEPTYSRVLPPIQDGGTLTVDPRFLNNAT